MKLPQLLVQTFSIACVSAFAPTRTRTSTTNTRTISSSLNMVAGNNDLWRDDNIVTLVPKFKIKDGCKEKYMESLPKFIDLVKANEGDTCIFYGFVGPTEDDHVICREGYVSAEGMLAHLDNVGDVLNEALESADIVELQVQGPAAELEKLKEPLAAFSPTYYPLVEGAFRSTKN